MDATSFMLFAYYWFQTRSRQVANQSGKCDEKGKSFKNRHSDQEVTDQNVKPDENGKSSKKKRKAKDPNNDKESKESHRAHQVTNENHDSKRSIGGKVSLFK